MPMFDPSARQGSRRRRSAIAAALLLVVPVLGGGERRAMAAPPATTKTAAAKKGSVPSGPIEESPNERRAVRGSALDSGGESPELSELRRFEEEAFPRSRSDGDGASSTAEPSSAPAHNLPGRWDGSGDVPEVLRTPELTTARAAPTPDSEWLRGLVLPELPVRWEPQVLRYLDYFRNDTRGRAIMSSWLRRVGRFRAVIENALLREGVPKDLLYVAMIESGFETNARSRVGAGGVWQFMPGAARAYGLEVGYWVDARRDPERSSEAAARYLKDLYVRFNSWPLVFAAYNAGYGAVLKSITRYNTNDYWELCRHEAGLPWESSLYVPKILAAAIVGHNLEAFGFADVVPDPPFSTERVDVPAGTTLATVARAANTRLDMLETLNPQLARQRTPPDRGNTAVRVPAGAGASFVAGLEHARGPADTLDTVTLRFGESLDDVAKARGTSARELRRLNNVKDSAELRAGVAIVVPRKKADVPRAGRGSVDLAGSDPSVAVREAGEGGDDDEVLVAVPDRAFNYEGRERVFYRTREGDTLEAIGDVLGVRVDDLVAWNNLDPEAKLHPRMVLQAFVRKDYDPTQIVLLDPARVRVVTLGSEEFHELEAARRGKKRLVVETKPGDTLAKLGRRYGLTVGDLARINRFSYNTELHDGQTIVVYSPVGEPARDVAQGLTSASIRHDRGVIDGLRGAAKGANGKPAAAMAAKLEHAGPAEKSGHGDKAERAGGKASGAAPTAKPVGRAVSVAAADHEHKDKAERPTAPRAEAKASAPGTKPVPKHK